MTRQVRASIALSALFLLTCSAAAPDTLFLRGHEQEPGRLAAMTKDTVQFEGRDGLKTFQKSEVLKIQLQRARLFDDVNTVDQIVDPDLKACLASQPTAEDFPAAGSVTLLTRQVYDLTEPGVVKDVLRKITKVLRQRGEDEATTSVWYFEDTDTPCIDFALTVTPDGRVLHLSDDALKNESIHADLPDYRRLARFRFANKEPRPGSVLDVQCTVVRKRGGPLEPFYAEELFRGDQPILAKEVVVLVREPDETRVLSELSGPDAVVTSREVSDGVVRLTWKLAKAQPGIVPEPLMPPSADFVPVLTLGEAATWEAVSSAYAEALAGLPALPQELVDKAVALDAENGPEAIHDFIVRAVRAVPVPQGDFRLLPHAPEATYRRALANALDTDFLYYRMLDAAGIPCSFALVRGRNQGPLPEGVPSLAAFNRSAVYLKKDGRFSVALSDVLPFSSLPGAMQDAPALLAEASGEVLTDTPRSAPGDELEATQFDAALDASGDLTLTVTYSGTGNAGTWLRNFKDADEQKLRNTLEQIAAYLHPSARLTDFSTTDLANLGVTPAITLHCVIPGYAVKAGDSLMLFDLPALAYDASDVGRPVREHELFWPHVFRDASHGAIRLPAGYRVYSLPEPVAFDSPTVSYRASLSTSKNEITFDDEFDVKVQDAPPEAYADYKSGKELRANIPRQRIILTR